MKFFQIIFLSLFTVLNGAQPPQVSIITSVYNGDQFIEGFMADIVQQTIFDQCELIMINANSRGNEEKVIRKYMKQYPNIIYIKLDHDPGLYGVWNIAIEKARAAFITNANLDDRLKPECYEKHLQALLDHINIDLVYSDFYLSKIPNETFETIVIKHPHRIAEFSRKAMRSCLPNNHPMWRKAMHTKYGLFDTSYKHLGDYEMWLRAVEKGAQFLRVPEIYGIVYRNPNGLSTSHNPRIKQELARIKSDYKSFFLKGPKK